MSENSRENQDFEVVEIEKEYMEIIDKAQNQQKLSKEEADKLLKQAKESIEFLKLIDNIKLSDEIHVVYTDGDIQLLYENGEFFLVSTTDSNGEKKKIKRKQAIDLYIEYFIKYQLNPIIKIKKRASLNKEKQQIRKQTRIRDVKEIKEEKDKEIAKKEKVKEEKSKKKTEGMEIER